MSFFFLRRPQTDSRSGRERSNTTDSKLSSVSLNLLLLLLLARSRFLATSEVTSELLLLT